MIRLVMLLLAVFVVVITGGIWQTVWGFYPLEPSNWNWLLDYAREYRALPPFFLPSLFTAMGAFLVLSVLVVLTANRIGSQNVHGKRDKESLHGSAHWATKDDVRAADLLRGTGAVVGGWPSAFKTKTLRHDGPEHILAFAPTRSGKGVGLVLPTLLSWPESALVLDIKGENWRMTSGWRATIGQRIFKFDPTAETGSIRFNPLSEIRLGTNHEVEDAQNISAMVIDPEGRGLRDFFTKEGFAWLTAAILYVLYRVREDERRCASLGDVSAMMSAPGDGLENLLNTMVEYDHRFGGESRAAVNELVHIAAQAMLDRAHPERSGVHSSARTELALYGDPVIAANIAESDFRLEDLMNGERPASLYLIVPPSDIDRLRPLLRVMMNMFLRRLMQNVGADGKPAHKHRLLLMLDEFTSIAKLEIFDRSLGFMGGYGLKAYLIVQDLAQIHQTYGRENGILGNCHVQIAYAPNDVATAKTLSDKCGTTTVVQRHRDRNRRALQLIGSVTDRLNEVSRPLLTPDECMRLRTAKKSRRDPSKIVRAGDMLIFVSGRPPILGRQALYFQNKTLLARSLMAPTGEHLRDGGSDDTVLGETPSGSVFRAGDAIRAAAHPAPKISSNRN